VRRSSKRGEGRGESFCRIAKTSTRKELPDRAGFCNGGGALPSSGRGILKNLGKSARDKECQICIHNFAIEVVTRKNYQWVALCMTHPPESTSEKNGQEQVNGGTVEGINNAREGRGGRGCAEDPLLRGQGKAKDKINQIGRGKKQWTRKRENNSGPKISRDH